MAPSFEALDQRELPGGYRLVVATYQANARPSIDVIAIKNGYEKPECRITVNLVEAPLADNEFHVKLETRTWSPEVFEALIAEGIAHPTGVVVSAGYVERYAEVWRLGRAEK